jgi:fatty-acyl-CoA synthase
VNINPAYRLAELEYALNKVGCKALITATALKTSDYIGMLNTLAPELASSKPGALKAAKLPALRTLVQIGGKSPGMYGFDEIAGLANDSHRAHLRELARKLQFDDPINIQFTSGTTGFPKGATLTHHNILNNGFFIGEGCRYTEQDRVCIPVPFYHCFGMVMGNLAATTHGACAVIPAPGFDPAATLAEALAAVVGGVSFVLAVQLSGQAGGQAAPPPAETDFDCDSLARYRAGPRRLL